jgi:anti-sigma factor RsiW
MSRHDSERSLSWQPARPRYWLRIDALRVDGTQSADPRDYAGWPATRPVGADLHAYCTAELDRDLAPAGMRRARGRIVRWPMQEAVLLERAPTVADLRRWASVRRIVASRDGTFQEVGGNR